MSLKTFWSLEIFCKFQWNGKLHSVSSLSLVLSLQRKQTPHLLKLFPSRGRTNLIWQWLNSLILNRSNFPQLLISSERVRESAEISGYRVCPLPSQPPRSCGVSKATTDLSGGNWRLPPRSLALLLYYTTLPSVVFWLKPLPVKPHAQHHNLCVWSGSYCESTNQPVTAKEWWCAL